LFSEKGDKSILSELKGVLGSYSWAGLGHTKRPCPTLFGTQKRVYNISPTTKIFVLEKLDLPEKMWIGTPHIFL